MRNGAKKMLRSCDEKINNVRVYKLLGWEEYKAPEFKVVKTNDKTNDDIAKLEKVTVVNDYAFCPHCKARHYISFSVEITGTVEGERNCTCCGNKFTWSAKTVL